MVDLGSHHSLSSDSLPPGCLAAGGSFWLLCSPVGWGFYCLTCPEESLVALFLLVLQTPGLCTGEYLRGREGESQRIKLRMPSEKAKEAAKERRGSQNREPGAEREKGRLPSPLRPGCSLPGGSEELFSKWNCLL